MGGRTMRSARPRVVNIDDYAAERAEMITPRQPSKMDWSMFFSGLGILAFVAIVAYFFWLGAAR
jgi:hypothetical protein